MLALERRRDDLGEVLGQGGRDGSQVNGLQIAGAHAVLQRKEECAVGVLCCEGGVVEREQECVDIRHPAEAWRRHARPHLDAIGEHGPDAGLGEHPVGEARAFAAFDVGAGGGQLLHAGGISGGVPAKPQSANQAGASCGLSGRQARTSVCGSMLSTGSASKSRSVLSFGGGRTGCAWLSMAGVEAISAASSGSMSRVTALSGGGVGVVAGRIA